MPSNSGGIVKNINIVLIVSVGNLYSLSPAIVKTAFVILLDHPVGIYLSGTAGRLLVVQNITEIGKGAGRQISGRFIVSFVDNLKKCGLDITTS